MNANRLWWLGGAVAAIVIAAVAYMLGISPHLAQASDAQSQKVDAQAQLQQTELQLASLKKQYASIDQLKARLAELQKSIPSSAQVSDFVRQLGDQASATDVTLTSISVSEPTTYAPGATGAAAAATSPATPAQTATATPTPDPTASAVAPPLGTDPAITSSNFVMLPVALNASGSSDQLLSFTKAVQDEGPRLFLVSKISLGSGSGSASAGTGSNTETLSGFIYVLVGNS